MCANQHYFIVPEMDILMYVDNLPYEIDDKWVVGKNSIVRVSSGQRGIQWNTDFRSQTTICEECKIIAWKFGTIQ